MSKPSSGYFCTTGAGRGARTATASADRPPRRGLTSGGGPVILERSKYRAHEEVDVYSDLGLPPSPVRPVGRPAHVAGAQPERASAEGARRPARRGDGGAGLRDRSRRASDALECARRRRELHRRERPTEEAAPPSATRQMKRRSKTAPSGERTSSCIRSSMSHGRLGPETWTSFRQTGTAERDSGTRQ
jgi:hypothetical protein